MNWTKLQDIANSAEVLTSEAMFYLIAHSVVIGFLLMLANICAQWVTTELQVQSTSSSKDSDGMNLGPAGQLVMASANVLFLSIGMCGIMLFVSNNLARAFAIGAAISVIRFRIKISKSTLGMSLFFGVLVGMACGVQQVKVAYGLAILFSILQLVIVFLSTVVDRKVTKNSQATQPTSKEIVIKSDLGSH